MTPTFGEEPCSAISPCGAAASTTSSHSTPAPTRAIRRSASISTPPMPLVLTSTVPLQVAERARVVARRLRGDAQAGGARGAHDLGDLARVGGVGDGGGALVDGEVEGLAGGVVARRPREGRRRRRTGRGGQPCRDR